MRDAAVEGVMNEELRATLRIGWQHYGSVKLDARGKLSFGKFPSGAYLYRFRVLRADGKREQYIGEAEDLDRRFARYRSPHVGQQTNWRLNAHCKDVLLEGGKIDIDITNHGWIAIDGIETKANLHWKQVRRTFEQLCLTLSLRPDCNFTSLNR